MRIQVFFDSTPILVPCGDGNLTVGELIQKAILRFKKVVDKVSRWNNCMTVVAVGRSRLGIND